jgi:hypothetical protein
MKHALRLALALTVAAVTWVAPAAHAQGGSYQQWQAEFQNRNAPGKFRIMLDEEYIYQDRAGFGTMTVAPMTLLPGGRQFFLVEISQNGRLFYGAGTRSGNAVDFVLFSALGRQYNFVGSIDPLAPSGSLAGSGFYTGGLLPDQWRVYKP